MHTGTCSILVSTCSILVSTCSILVSTCSILVSTCSILVGTCSILVGTCSIHEAYMRHTCPHIAALPHDHLYEVECVCDGLGIREAPPSDVVLAYRP